MTRHQNWGVIAAAAIIALTGCVPAGPVGPTPAPTLPSTSPTETIDDGEVIDAPTADPDSQSSAVATAEAAVAAYARPDLSPAAWYDGLLPHLSQRGADAYLGTDPSTIPATRVTGDGTVLEGSTEVLLIVTVPTDAGTYNVTMTRSDATRPWLAERIRPAQG